MSPHGPTILVVLLFAGLLIVQLLLPHLINVEDGRGVPQNWFPAVLAFLTAMLALPVSRQRRRLASALLAVATICLAFSIDHGADFAWADEWLSTRFLAPSISGALVGAVIVAAAGLLWTRSSEHGARVGVALWALLLIPVVMVEPPDVLRTGLSLAAHASGFGGLLFLLPRRPEEPGAAAYAADTRISPGTY